jgi:hypothetical protein
MELASIKAQAQRERQDYQGDRPIGDCPIQQRENCTPKTVQEIL